VVYTGRKIVKIRMIKLKHALLLWQNGVFFTVCLSETKQFLILVVVKVLFSLEYA
jgi:sulfur transfer complex TusBCD TusB component (DsrH family)